MTATEHIYIVATRISNSLSPDQKITYSKCYPSKWLSALNIIKPHMTNADLSIIDGTTITADAIMPKIKEMCIAKK